MSRFSRFFKALLRSRQRRNALTHGACQEISRQRFFSYVRVGFDQRTIEFLGDHRIGRGADKFEQTWRVQRRNAGPLLLIKGKKGITCALHPAGAGRWRGAWRLYEKMEILLKPAVPAGQQQDLRVGSRLFSPATNTYSILQRYRRTVALDPDDKELIPVASEADAPRPFGRAVGRLSDEVLFFKLQDMAAGREYWAKKYHPDQQKQLPLELGLYAELSKLHLKEVVLPVDYRDDFGLIFDFNPELFSGRIVHVEHARTCFNTEHAREILAFAETAINHPVLGRLAMGELCDFQSVLTSRGLLHIDFMIRPRHWWNL